MKNVMAAAAIVLSAGAVFAEGEGPGFGGGPKGMGGEFMQNLTDDQKACIEAHECPKMGKPDGGFKKGNTPDERPEFSDEEKAQMQENRDCMKKAFENCGIKMPEKPKGMRDRKKN